MDPEVPGSSPGGGTILAPSAHWSAHARYAAHTAGKRGFAFRALEPDGYLFEIADGARRAVFSSAAGTPYALNAAHANAIARDKGFTERVLAARGLRHIPSQLFFVNDAHKHLRGQGRELADARAFAAAARYPIFCKPIDGSQGAFAEIISDEAQFARYLARVGARHYAILVQPVIEAPEYRVFVLDGRALFSYRKARPLLTGDGKSTLQELARAPETVRAYDEKGACYRAADVAPAGALLHLEGAANLAAGGAAENLTTQTPARFADVAIAATSAIGLRLAAVDLFDLAGDLIIIEVNSSPAIKTLELHDRWDLIETIWTANIDAALL